jgi:hypothetical protein
MSNQLHWTCNFYIPIRYEEDIDPLEKYIKFFEKEGIKKTTQLENIKRIEYGVDKNGNDTYVVDYYSEEEAKKYNGHIWQSSWECLFSWTDLANVFDKSKHKWCEVEYNGEKKVIEYFESYETDYSNRIYYETFEKEVADTFNKRSLYDYSPDDKEQLAKAIFAKYSTIELPEKAVDEIRTTDSKSRIAANLYNSWYNIEEPQNNITYKVVKRPVDSYINNPFVHTSINEEYITTDNVEKPNGAADLPF